MRFSVILAALCLTSSSPAVTKELPSEQVFDSTRLLLCQEGLGTAWVVGDNMLATAWHVAAMTDCRDAYTNELVVTKHVDTKHDFALVSMNTAGMTPLTITCSRFSTGRSYYSYGFGGGRFMVQRMKATRKYSDEKYLVGDEQTPMPGMRRLEGTVIGGQSGGPIVDGNGVVYGINNVSSYGFGISHSYELADTILCKE